MRRAEGNQFTWHQHGNQRTFRGDEREQRGKKSFLWVVWLWTSYIPRVRDVGGRISIPEYTSEEHVCFCSKYDPDYLPTNPDWHVITTQCLPSLQGKWDSYSTASLFSPSPCPSHPTKGPVLLLGGTWHEPFGCGPLLGLPKGALWCSSREGDHPPMQLELGGVRDRIPTPQSIPATGSHLVPALCPWVTWKAPHPSAWASAFAPCCCSTCHTPVVEGGLSHCLWYETLGCWVE